jgi:CheY-like chemotaxis protein
MDLVRASVGSRVAVELTIEPGVPAVTADAAELELAILNLAINARDAMPRGGTLRVQALRAPAAPTGGAADEVLIRVSDDGEGIPPELVERVFEPFFTTKPEGKGAGLGLAQVRAASEQVGGRVSIDSAPGGGTTVTLVLPAATRPTPQAAARPDAQARIACTLLLVEDNPELAATTDALLRSFGARVTRAATADAALERVGSDGGGFDVVLSDIVMAGSRNGLELARELRRRFPSLPVVLLTGYAREAAAALGEGFPVLAKPCVPEELVAAIQRAVAARPASVPG